MLAEIIDQINTLKYSPTKKDSPKPPEPTTMVPDNKRAPPLNSGQYTESGVMWNLKNEIISPRFYDLLTNTELKVDTTLDLNNLYNHIKMR